MIYGILSVGFGVFVDCFKMSGFLGCFLLAFDPDVYSIQSP